MTARARDFKNVFTEGVIYERVKLRFLYGLRYQGLYFLRIKNSVRCCKGSRTQM